METIYIYKVWDENDDGYQEWYGDIDELIKYAKGYTELYTDEDNLENFSETMKVFDKLGISTEEVWSKQKGD